MKITFKATFSEYKHGCHSTDGKRIEDVREASIAESLSPFHYALFSLARRGLRTGTRLKVTIETIKKRK